MLIAVGSIIDSRQDRLVRFRESRMRFRRPLHWRAGAIALGQLEIIPHADLVAITNDRRSGQCEHQTVGELDAAPVPVEHGREPASNAALIELHLLLGSKAFEHALALLLNQAAGTALAVLAQEQ